MCSIPHLGERSESNSSYGHGIFSAMQWACKAVCSIQAGSLFYARKKNREKKNLLKFLNTVATILLARTTIGTSLLELTVLSPAVGLEQWRRMRANFQFPAKS